MLRLYRHVVNGVLLILFVLACTIRVDGRKLYEFLAVTKVDGLPPAPSPKNWRHDHLPRNGGETVVFRNRRNTHPWGQRLAILDLKRFNSAGSLFLNGGTTSCQ